MMVADLYGDVPTKVQPRWQDYAPGLIVVTLGTLAAGFVSDHYGAPLTLMALLLGLSLNFLSADKRLQPGLGFASQSLLRWGIVLVGGRVTLGQMMGMGPAALLSILMIVALTIMVGVVAARLLKFDTAFGVLAGGSVAICGASAALALSATLGQRRISEAQLTLVLVGISAMSAAAMVCYPIAAHLLSLSDLRAGFLLGASIHDVAQSIGAGYAYSQTAGEIAAIVKLTRVALLAPVLTMIALYLADKNGEVRRLNVPWFVVGFFAMAGINSTVAIPPIMADAFGSVAAALLAAAVTATAIRSPLPQLLEAGPKPLLVILAGTVTAFLAALTAALLAIG